MGRSSLVSRPLRPPPRGLRRRGAGGGAVKGGLLRVASEVSSEQRGAASPPAPGPRRRPRSQTPTTSTSTTTAVSVDDGLELPADPSTGARAHSPLSAMTEAQIEELLSKDPAALGPMSLGATNAGALFNGVRMPEGDRWELVDPAHAWGTRETIDAIDRAIGEVHRQFPGSPKLYIGHISARERRPPLTAQEPPGRARRRHQLFPRRAAPLVPAGHGGEPRSGAHLGLRPGAHHRDRRGAHPHRQQRAAAASRSTR